VEAQNNAGKENREKKMNINCFMLEYSGKMNEWMNTSENRMNEEKKHQNRFFCVNFYFILIFKSGHVQMENLFQIVFSC
jgi:hypothetical protein